MAKTRHIKKTTLIIVAEGAHDKAFLDHMKSVYDHRDSGQKVTINSADGGSPHDVIKTAIKKTSHAAYDQKYIFMDSDVAIKQQDLSLAKKNNIIVLLSEPLCLEGMLLDILGQRIPETSELCKRSLHPQLAGQPTEAKSYTVLFPQSILDVTTKQAIVDLKTLLINQVKKIKKA